MTQNAKFSKIKERVSKLLEGTQDLDKVTTQDEIDRLLSVL